MRGQDVVYFIFVLILGYLILANWKGANQVIATSASGFAGLVKTLQGR